jgi:chemosensory pili system protein ChpA (sensor histidine kinase/response regulator)
MPTDSGSVPPLPAEPAALQDAREALTQAKDAWNKYASGNPPSLPAFRSASGVLKDHTGELGNPDVAVLARELAVLATWLSSNTSKMSEAIALEVATALLLLENALANLASLGADFTQQSQFVCARLKACVLGKLLRTAPTIPLLDEMSRKAQERLVLSQVVTEIQANLRSIEQVLDAFFRDSAKRGDLMLLGSPLHQVKGALDILGESRARDALDECEAQIGRFAQADYAPREEDFERIAQMLAGLGFYIEALALREADFDAAMRPIGAKRAPYALESEAQQGLRVLQATADEVPLEPTIAQALEQAVPERETPAPSPETTRLMDASAEKIDAELFGVYLEEAEEVLAGICEHLALVRTHPADRPALATIRRAFYTLKGSGRMVGLARLGEAAWAVEQTMNLWLQEERAATPDLVSLVRVAHDYFADNVARLKQGGVCADESALTELAARVKRGEPLTAQPAAAGEPPAAPTMAAPVPPEEEFVAIGEEKVSKPLFTVFAIEARSHLDTMARELEVLAQQAVITDALIRAAHTLAGISATVKLDAVRYLSHALEQALERLAAGSLSAVEEELIGEVFGALSAMVAQAASQTQPLARPDLIARLRRAAIPAWVESSGSVMLPEEEGALAREPDAIPAPLAAGLPIEPPRPPVVEEAQVESRQPRIRDDLDPQHLPLFLEEASDLLPAIGGALRNWRAQSGETGLGRSLQRLLHTMKGGARLAGAMEIGELIHRMEARVEDALLLTTPPETLFDALDASYDRLGILFEEVRSKTATGPSEAQPPRAAAPVAQDIALPGATLRVRAGLADRLVNQAGEVSLAHSRIDGEMRSLRTAMDELADKVVRLRSKLREIEIQAESQMQSRMREIRDAGQGFDTLEFDRFTRFQELTRLMAESVNDVQTVHRNLIHAVDETEAELLAQARLNRDLQQNLMRVRMVPFSSLSERLYRVVRQTAGELGKRVNLDIRGAQVDLDRSVLERVTAPLEHLLRNAITHGIESPTERAAKGKPEIGEVRIEISQEGNAVLLAMADDGRGLDMARIREQAISMGLPGESIALSDAEIAQFIFLPGFTTATVVTEIAGRGVGMDVVRTEVAALGGRIDLEFEKDKGTSFIIHLPPTRAVTQAVLVKAAGRS